MRAALNLWNIAAGILWFLLLQRRLRHVVDKQAPGQLLLFFFAGVLSVILTSVLHEIYFLPWLVRWVYESDLLYGVLVTGVIEETAKFLCFLVVAHGLVTVKEPQDGVLQGAAVGLGFATIENLLYIDRYPEIFIAVRPLICTGGHMVYGAVWGGLYSAAMWSNAHSDDPGSWRLALAGVGAMAVFHGLYNSAVVYGLVPGAVVDGVVLLIATTLFLRLQERSPYRQYSLSQARMAVDTIRRGLVFNRKSPILNRRLGLYLMRLGDYRDAAGHLSRAVPRSHDRLSTRFFAAAGGFAFQPKHHAERSLRLVWGRLSDRQRTRLMEQLGRLLEDDQPHFQAIKTYLSSAFTQRRGLRGRALARQIKLRKAARRRAGSPAFDRVASELTEAERVSLKRKLRRR